jgi:hypothetical protein
MIIFLNCKSADISNLLNDYGVYPLVLMNIIMPLASLSKILRSERRGCVRLGKNRDERALTVLGILSPVFYFTLLSLQ